MLPHVLQSTLTGKSEGEILRGSVVIVTVWLRLCLNQVLLRNVPQPPERENRIQPHQQKQGKMLVPYGKSHCFLPLQIIFAATLFFISQPFCILANFREAATHVGCFAYVAVKEEMPS